MKHEWSVRVRTDSCNGLVAAARNHSWRVGDPITFAPKDAQPSALELAMGALAADLLGNLRRVCKERRIALDEAEISLRITLDNPLMTIGVIGEEGSPAIDRIDGVVYVSSFQEDEVRAAWEQSLRRSSLFATFSRAAGVDLRLNIVP